MTEPEASDAEFAISACQVRSLPYGPPLLLSAREAAALVGVSERTWRTWDLAGRIPPPIVLGRSKFWSPFELVEWVRQRCPRCAESA